MVKVSLLQPGSTLAKKIQWKLDHLRFETPLVQSIHCGNKSLRYMNLNYEIGRSYELKGEEVVDSHCLHFSGLHCQGDFFNLVPLSVYNR